MAQGSMLGFRAEGAYGGKLEVESVLQAEQFKVILQMCCRCAQSWLQL